MEDQIVYDTTEALKKADELRKDKTDTELGLLRRRAKTDLYFFGNTILNFPDLTVNLHGNLAEWKKATEDALARLVLMPRGHLKTSMEIADAMQVILPDDIGNQPYPRNLGTNTRILLAHEVLGSAQNNLRIITDKIHGQEFLIALFPEIVPNTGLMMANGKRNIGLTVNQSKLQLPRSDQFPETTFSTMGVGSAGQGNHFDLMKIDDIVGLAAMKSPAEYATAVDWIKDLPGMLVNMSMSKMDFTGVRYAKNDIYAMIKDYFSRIIKVYTRSIWERNEKNEKVIIFPERITWERIEDLKKDLARFNSQYMNNPQEVEGEFSQEWERYYSWQDDYKRNIVVHTTDGKTDLIDIRSLDKLILIDPALDNGLTGMAITGTDPQSRTYTLDTIQEKFKTEELIDTVFKLVEKWNPRAVVIEKVLFSKLYEPLFKAEMKLRGKHFRVIMVSTGNIPKEDRVRILRPWFANSKIFFNKSQENIIEQYREFPGIKDYHILDVLAYGPEVWRAASNWDEDDQRNEAIRRIREQRGYTKGYSEVRYA